jgi:hypothetical protein
MASKHRRILCFLFITATGIYILYNWTYGINGTSPYMTSSSSSFVTRANMTVGNLSKLLTKTTFIRIKETFSKINKEFRRQKKQMLAKSVSSLETTQELYLSCPSDLFLLILVPSRPNSVLNRIAMRVSWARSFKPSKEGNLNGSFIYQVVFVITEHSAKNGSLINESKKFGDILRVGHDSRNLTVIPAIYRLLSRKCKPKFLLVLDGDNTYVNVAEVLSWLSKLNPKVKYAGSVRQSLAAENLSNTSNNAQNFIPYCVGGVYVLAGKILKRILYTSKVIPPSKYGTNEAMYVGTLTNYLGIKPYNDDRFSSHPFEDLNIRDIDPCTVKKEVFVHHVFRLRHILLYTKMIVVGEQPCVSNYYES